MKPLQYWYTLWIVAALALLGPVAEYVLGYRAVGFLFLAAVLVLGLFYSLGPVLFGAFLSSLIWDYFFIPPHYTLAIKSAEDTLMIAAYFIAAVTTGILAGQVRGNQRALESREQRTRLLYELVSRIVSGDQNKTLIGVSDLLVRALGREFVVFLLDKKGALVNRGYAAQPFQLTAYELQVASQALETGLSTGWSTDHRPEEGLLYVPLMGAKAAVGLLVCRPRAEKKLSVDESELLQAACRQLALSLERERLERISREAELLRESEQLHQALLNSISHELRTPLTAMMGSAAALKDASVAADPARRAVLLDELSGAGERLNRVIENLLDMARLNSGALALKREWHDPAELLRLTLGRLKTPLAGHILKLAAPEGLPLISIDYRLMEHALSNLLLNAAAYAPGGSAITVSARLTPDSVVLSVADEGPGLPPDAVEKVFEKFYRLPGSPAGGTGLGLYITRSLMRAHGGQAVAVNRPQGGAKFSLILPLEKAPDPPAERPR